MLSLSVRVMLCPGFVALSDLFSQGRSLTQFVNVESLAYMWIGGGFYWSPTKVKQRVLLTCVSACVVECTRRIQHKQIIKATCMVLI